MGQKRNFASAFKSDLVSVYVGPDKQKYTPHKDILTQAKFFAGCLKSRLRESENNEIILSEEEPEAFEKLLEYLYHGNIEADSFEIERYGDSKDRKREDETLIQLTKVWIAADKYCMESCQNHVMDYFLRYRVNRILSPLIISETSKRGLRDCLLRKLVMADLAVDLMRYGNDWDYNLKKDENIMKPVGAGGIDAQDLFKAILAWVAIERDDEMTEKPCQWHVHKLTKKCPLPMPNGE